MDLKRTPPYPSLPLLNIGMASLLFLQMLYLLWSSRSPHFLVFAVLLVLFASLQFVALRLAKTEKQIPGANWFIISAHLLCILGITVFVHNSLLICLYFLVAIPLNVAVTRQLKQLPSVLFLTFVAAALTIFIDLILPLTSWHIIAIGPQLWLLSGGVFLSYLACLGFITFQYNRYSVQKNRLKINVATQYALAFTGISAMIIILVTGVMIYQVRNAQINQVGKSFQTIAENFAKLVGSHLEQQTQKLQLLTQQVPIFKEELIFANTQYKSRSTAQDDLIVKNRLWEGPLQNDTFIMSYLNNPLIRALSRFRGHNSFHNDLVLVDGYGGLVASLGQKPERFYFYDQSWWKIAWNGGLGNIFIGDLESDTRTKIPKLRIAVEIIDRSTNEVIGMLSSIYLLRQLLEDIKHFIPDTVDQISLTDAQGRVITSTNAEITNQQVWAKLSELNSPKASSDSGWVMERDHLDQPALIGFSTLSTAYNVISDPLHRLGWHVVVSGTRSNALVSVTQSTKLALLVGLVAMAIGVLGAIAAARVITRPIEDLTATASAMIEGDLNQRAQLTGPEELVALSAGFNRLTDRLHTVIKNLKTQAQQLAKAKSGAEAATKLKGEFLANMSHEIRTPLNAILGFADILESSLTDKKQKRHAQTIKTSGGDLLHLINDILDLSKIEAGRMEIQISPVNLRTLFDGLKRIFSISSEEKMIGLEMEVAQELPSLLMLDRVRLRQVLFNLIGNAVKFTTQGKVECLAQGTLGHEGNTWNLKIEVRDTGIGIDPEAHSEIFETFKQHKDASGKNNEGTGLGLAISKSLIEMMGGQISVKGEKGKGSVFSISIPQVLATDGATDTVTGVNNTQSKKYLCFDPASILVADDLEVNRHLILEALKPHPLKIDQAEHGKAAVSMAADTTYDLILMDIRMPGMDGYSAFQKIQNLTDRPSPFVIATTAAGMKEDIAKIKQTGFTDYLIRPFDQEALLQLLKQYLPHTYTDKTVQSIEVFQPINESYIVAEPPWTCPPEAENYLFKTLRHRWEQVSLKQSIPDIISFANDVQAAGEKYHISLLTRYGKELGDYSEGFDIHNVEKLLQIYEVILNCRANDACRDTEYNEQ